MVFILFNLDNCLAFLTHQSSKLFAEALDNKFRPYHVTRSQWIAMYYIFNNEDISQRELADKMGSKEPSVVRLIQRLELEGLLCRHGINEDKRIKQLKLSVKGEEVYHKLLPVAENFKNNTIKGISEQDLQTFEQVLKDMKLNILNN